MVQRPILARQTKQSLLLPPTDRLAASPTDANNNMVAEIVPADIQVALAVVEVENAHADVEMAPAGDGNDILFWV